MANSAKTFLKKTTGIVKKGIKGSLNNTYNHYSCFLPSGKGVIIPFFMKLFFAGIKFDDNQIRKIESLDKEGIIVYTTKYRSYFEFLFSHTRFRQKKLPRPELGFGYRFVMFQPLSRLLRIAFAHILHFLKYASLQNPYKSGYVREELMNGRSGFMTMIEKKGLYNRFVKSKTDPLKYLINIQKSTSRPVYIIPQLIFFSTRPQRSNPSIVDILFGSEDRPRRLRRLLILFKSPKKIFVELSDPVDIGVFLSREDIAGLDTDEQAIELRRHIIDILNRHRQSITGPHIKSREELKDALLADNTMQAFLKSYAEESGTPIQQINKKVDSYFEEIAADYSLNWIKAYDMVLTWILNNIFEGMIIDHEGLAKVRERAKEAPLILVPCHKSHLDYLILSYVFHHNNMPCPHIAAGKNLSFWPLGTIFRGGGAFFIRRTFKGAPLYSRIFAEYVKKILSEGFNIEFFIEGGRSRTGKLLSPKLGLLNILLSAFFNGASKDLMFVPIYIGYDRVLEEQSYIHEIEGGQKKAESVSQLVSARKSLKKRYGKVYVNFHEPLSLNEYLKSNNYNADAVTPEEQSEICADLGNRFINAINTVSIVTPYGIVSSAALNCPHNFFTFDEINEIIDTYMTFLVAQDAKLADTLLIDHQHTMSNVFNTFIERGFIEKLSKEKNGDFPDTRYKVNENKRPGLDYYKNNSIASFIPAAYTAMAIIKNDAFQFATSDIYPTYNFIRDLFMTEFPDYAQYSPEYIIRKTLKSFIDDAIIVPHPTLPDTYNVTSAGFRKLKVFASFLKTYFESYWIVLNFFIRYPKNAVSPKDQFKKMQSMGTRMYKRSEIKRPEAINKINHKNAFSYFAENITGSPDEKEKIDFYKDAITKYLNLLSS